MRPEILEKIKSSSSKQVNLDDMGVIDQEIAEIGEFIVKNKPKLEQLYLDRNSLTDEGAKILATWLEVLEELTILTLQYNRIDREGIEAIYSVMEKNPNLGFHLCGNKMRDVSEVKEIKDNILAKLGITASVEAKETPLPRSKKKKW